MNDNTLTHSNIDVLNGATNTYISDHYVIFNIPNVDNIPTVNSAYS